MASLYTFSLPFRFFCDSLVRDNRYAITGTASDGVHDTGQWSALLLFFGVCFVRCVLASLDHWWMLEHNDVIALESHVYYLL